MAVYSNAMLIPHDFWWAKPCCSAPPEGMKVKKLPKKKVLFDNAVSPAPYIRTGNNLSGFPARPSDYVSTVMSVITLTDISMRAITYDLTGADGFRFRLYREVHLWEKVDAAFREYLIANGIKGSYWHDYLGCQEMVSFDYFCPPQEYITYARYCGMSLPRVGPIVETSRRFIYEPKGGGGNAKRR